MIKTLFVLLLVITANYAEAQRVYAPVVTGSGEVHVENESLVFILTPEKIKKIKTTEKQAHIKLTDKGREYFYTLTWLNKGKHLTIKNVHGETVQTGIIRQAVDSGVIISKTFKKRGNLLSFVRHLKEDKKPIIIEKRKQVEEE